MHARPKHIEIDMHYIIDQVLQNKNCCSLCSISWSRSSF